MLVRNETQNTILISEAKLAASFLTRLKGLLGADPLQPGQGLVLKGVKSIHTLFMGFPLDVIYLDANKTVIRTDTNMVPYRLGPYLHQAAYVLELPVGAIESSHTSLGDQISFS